jgi:hypothetical protein
MVSEKNMGSVHNQNAQIAVNEFACDAPPVTLGLQSLAGLDDQYGHPSKRDHGVSNPFVLNVASDLGDVTNDAKSFAACI